MSNGSVSPTTTQISLEQIQTAIKSAVQDAIAGFVASSEASKQRENRILTLAETAKFLRISEVTLHKLKRDRKIRYHKVGRRVIFRESDLITYLERRK